MHITNNNLHTTRIPNKNQNATTKEGNIELRPPKQHRRKKKNRENKNKEKVPDKTKQTKLTEFEKEKIKTLFDYT